MENKKLKVGIIGLGRIGQVHLQALKSVKKIKVVAVSDINADFGKQIAEENNITNFYTDYKDLISQKDIDAVWICSPTDQHYAQVTEALKNNKYVFCEKPLETDLNKIQNIINTYENINHRLMIGFNRRFDPDFSFAQSKINEVGTPTIVKITSRDPAPPPLEYIKASGGIYNDMTIHDLDMARFLTGSEVEQVTAVGAINYIEGIEGIDIDTTLITLKFKNGILCNIDNSRKSSHGYDQRIEILGDKGMISVDNKKINQCNFYSDKSIKSSLLEPFFLERYKDSYVNEAECFLDSVVNNKEFPCTAQDALNALTLANACKRSLEERQSIFLN